MEEQHVSKTQLIIICLLVLVCGGSLMLIDIYSPSFPTLVNYFHTSTDAIKLSMSAYLVGISVPQLIYGPLSDRFGRRYLMLFGILLVVLSSVLIVYSHDVKTLILGRLLEGVGAAGVVVLGRVMLKDMFSGMMLAKILSYFAMVVGLAPAFSPMIGGILETHLGWQSNFIFISTYFFAVLCLFFFLLPETNQHKNRDATKMKVVARNYVTILSNSQFISYTLGSLTAFAGLVAYMIITPFLFAYHFNVTPSQFGMLVLPVTIAGFFARLANTRIVVKWGVPKTFLFGIGIMFFSSLVMLLSGLMGFVNLVTIITIMALYTIGTGFIFGNAIVGAFEPFPRMAGSAGGIYGFIQILGTGIVSLLSAPIHANSQAPIGLLQSVVAGISLLLFYRHYKSNVMKSHK